MSIILGEVPYAFLNEVLMLFEFGDCNLYITEDKHICQVA